MKQLSLFFALLLLTKITLSQHVGIGISNPPELFTVNGTALIDASNLNTGFFPNGNVLKFGTVGGVGIGSNKIGGPSTNGLEFFTKFDRRMVIDSNGYIGINGNAVAPHRLTINGSAYLLGLGIGTPTPDLVAYKIDINGSARTRLDSYINRDLWVDRNLDVDGTTNFLGDITASNDVSVGGNVTVAGNITTDGGKGVIRSTNSTQQVMGYPSGSVGYTNAPSGYTDDVEFAYSNVFSANPTISLAHISNATGTFERWTYYIHSINNTTRRFWVRFYNASNGPSTFSATFHFIAVGPAL